MYMIENILVEGKKINEMQQKFCLCLPEGLIYNRDGFRIKMTTEKAVYLMLEYFLFNIEKMVISY